MSFVEIEERKVTHSYNMSTPQAHSYYELYFLMDGTREIFVENKMFLLNKNSLCIIPPFFTHKTEGKAYDRINVYFSQDILDENEKNFLSVLANDFAFNLTQDQADYLFPILKKSANLSIKLKKTYLKYYVKIILSFLMSEKPRKISTTSTTKSPVFADELILKIVSYINNNYNKNITLKFLSNKFFISTNTLCKRFKSAMNSSVNQYLMLVRFSKAKMYLLQSNKNIEEISELCGFSSANYFGTIFKEEFGLSPLNYRKKN